MRIGVVVFFLAVCLAGIGYVFWHQELQYALPTPVPVNYTAVPVSGKIELSGILNTRPDTPVYMHFFNPDCPCSRFNSKHFLDLANRFKSDFQIFAVIPAYADVARARAMIGEVITVIQDHDDQLASACGVYATPQAVVIGKDHQLFYRGNYNKSRYCTQPETNYAEQALTALVRGEPAPAFSPLATQAYGCELPSEEARSFFEF